MVLVFTKHYLHKSASIQPRRVPRTLSFTLWPLPGFGLRMYCSRVIIHRPDERAPSEALHADPPGGVEARAGNAPNRKSRKPPAWLLLRCHKRGYSVPSSHTSLVSQLPSCSLFFVYIRARGNALKESEKTKERNP